MMTTIDVICADTGNITATAVPGMVSIINQKGFSAETTEFPFKDKEGPYI